MADVIKKTTNKFNKGLVLDFSPENTGNLVLTHALNATLLTFNGNELSLQNDMGNARVETAFLPNGYIPVGTCEYGGIIYIVSYNPLEDKSLIGCFPSPERNISSDELGIPNMELSNSDFVDYNGIIESSSKYVLLKNDKLNPGDKFIISANDSIYDEKLKDLFVYKEMSGSGSDGNNPPSSKSGVTPIFGGFTPINNPVLALNVVSIEDSGKIIYLNSDIKLYKREKLLDEKVNTYKYHILGSPVLNGETFDQTKVDIDEFRNVLSSGYSVFKSKTSGKLAILAELIMIDSYSVTHSINPKQDSDGKDISGEYDIIIHTEVSSEETNYNLAPKLKYYYLENSLGYLPDDTKLFNISENGDVEYNDAFFDTKLSDIYNIDDPNITLKDTASFNFPKLNTYHGEMSLYTDPYDKSLPSNVFTKFYANKKHSVLQYQIALLSSYPNIKFTFYQILSDEGLVLYKEISEDELKSLSSDTRIFITVSDDVYIPNNIFAPYPDINNILGYSGNTIGDPISLHKISNFLPDFNLKYDSVKFASIKLPEMFANPNIKVEEGFPFKYEYTLIPCMNYGKLQHLAVSNKINFANLRNFEASNFNVWKYRIDSNQLRLTFGAEIYDAVSSKKVTGLILEFYDHRGFAGSIEITGKKSYSGVFTRIISLDSANSISKKLIIGNEYKQTNFKRNINISLDSENVFKLNGHEVEYIDSNKGWEYVNYIDESETPNNPDVNRSVSDNVILSSLPDDCGTLYSNVLYGVKTYLKCKEGESIEFEEKNQFFLYTIPFYNDQYYNCDNFNDLEGPSLDMILTYRLEDESVKSDYNEGDIINGYDNGEDSTDYTNFKNYFSGEQVGSLFDIIKYYKYEGTTTLLLEVGLLKEYENFFISCDPNINDEFLCTLMLSSDTNPNFPLTITSGEYEGLSSKEILNYKSNMDLNLNNIWIGDDTSLLSISNLNIGNYNFYNRQKPDALKLNYRFVVGYKINVSDIVLTEVPTTTVCALCHKKPFGEYNYEDFGIYLSEDDNYLSKCMFYNSGTQSITKFGIGRQKDYDNSLTNLKLVDYVDVEEYYSGSAAVSKTNPLNSGGALKSVSLLIGKLQFCLPHIHCINTDNGVNVRGDEDELDYIVPVRKNESIDNLEDSTWGITGSHRLYHWPRFTMSLNTKNSIEFYDEFVSTMNSTGSVTRNIPFWAHLGSNNEQFYKDVTCYTFGGVGADTIKSFNLCLIETMKSIYVYNPDYDSILINKGIVTTLNYNPLFISNILIKNGKFNITSLNDYIYLFGFKFSKYLEDLETYSNISTKIEHLELRPNITLCGGEDIYLLTSLTYNVGVPNELKYEFEQNLSNTITIKHENGTIEFIKGILEDTKSFYGYKNGKLIQLDVSNYNINENGMLNIEYNFNDDNNIILTQQTSLEEYSRFDPYTYSYDISNIYVNTCLKYSTITINDLLYDPNSEHRLFIKKDHYFKTDKKLFYRKVYMGKNEPWDNDYYNNGDEYLNKNSLHLYAGPSFNET